MNVHFFVNASRNRGNRLKEPASVRNIKFLFVRIVPHSGISRRETMKILKNVNNGGSVTKISWNVNGDNGYTEYGSRIVNGAV